MNVFFSFFLRIYTIYILYYSSNYVIFLMMKTIYPYSIFSVFISELYEDIYAQCFRYKLYIVFSSIFGSCPYISLLPLTILLFFKRQSTSFVTNFQVQYFSNHYISIAHVQLHLTALLHPQQT